MFSNVYEHTRGHMPYPMEGKQVFQVTCRILLVHKVCLIHYVPGQTHALHDTEQNPRNLSPDVLHHRPLILAETRWVICTTLYMDDLHRKLSVPCTG